MKIGLGTWNVQNNYTEVTDSVSLEHVDNQMIFISLFEKRSPGFECLLNGNFHL